MIVIFNPVAGMRRASLLWRVLDVLVANGIRIELTETHRPGHAEALAREAACGGASMVVAAGGDGTIAEVANGLLGSSARLGVIPLGSANVLAHELAFRSSRAPWRRRWHSGGPGRSGRAWRAAPRRRGCSCRCWASGSMRRSCTVCPSR